MWWDTVGKLAGIRDFGLMLNWGRCGSRAEPLLIARIWCSSAGWSL
jgi:hypothetical protein